MPEIRSPLVAVLAALLLAFAAPARAQDDPSGEQFRAFLEAYATAADRGTALGALVPGTEIHDEFTCLHLQSEGRLAEAEAVLARWLERVKKPTPRYRRMEARQALLAVSEDPDATYEFLRETLDLDFRALSGGPDGAGALPTRLDPERISTDRLLPEFLDFRGQPSPDRRDPRWLERLVGTELPRHLSIRLLGRLPRADVPGLMALVVEDFRANPSLEFGKREVHRKLTLAQLEELRRAVPTVASNARFVEEVLRRLEPAFGESLDRRATRAAYVERLWNAVEPLPQAFDSLKAHVLHQRLRLDLETGDVDAERLRRYLALPRVAAYAPPRESGSPIDLGARFSATPFPAIGDDLELVEDYLAAVLPGLADYSSLLPVLEEGFLRRAFARAKLLRGDPADGARWTAMLSGPGAVDALRSEVILEFAPGVPRTLEADAPVTLAVDVKHVDELSVRVFAIDPVAAFDRLGDLDVEGLDLGGLVPSDETRLAFDEPPITLHTESIAVPAAGGPGLFVVELVGGGRSCRAVLRKGSLRLVERAGAAGHMLRVLGPDGRARTDALLRFGGRDYAPTDSGEILVPYTERPGKKTVLLRAGALATVVEFRHEGERYELEAASHVSGEALLAGSEATFITRPRLLLNGAPVDLGTLEGARLVVTAQTIDATVTSETFTDLALAARDEWTTRINVPERTTSFSLALHGEVRSLVDGRSVALKSKAQTFDIAEKGSATAQSHLVADADGYRLEVRGRNGEPLAGVALEVRLRNDGAGMSVIESLATDAAGGIALGELEDIGHVSVTNPAHLRGSWPIARARHFGLPRRLHARTGTPVRVPYPGRLTAPERSAFSLLELRGGAVLRDAFDALSIEDGYVVLRGLPQGEYDLTLKEFYRSYDVFVLDGAVSGSYVVGEHVALELTDPLPLHITDVARTDAALVVSLAGFGPATRVHVTATHFVDRYDAAEDLALGPVATGWRRFELAASSFAASHALEAEHRYILARQRSEPWRGNMPARPGVLLNPWDVHGTDAADDLGGDDEPFGARFGGERNLRAGGRASDRIPATRWATSQWHQFLAEPAVVLPNLVPDAAGQVRVPLAALGAKHLIQIVAVDDEHVSAVDVNRAAVEPARRDLRLQRPLPFDAPRLGTERIALLRAGESLRIEDGTSARSKTYGTLRDVFELFASSGDDEFQRFEFLTRWPSLADDEKRALYSEFVCHELNAFLRVKDPAFFAEVARPYLANKLQRTFLDDWLLDADVTPYLAPWRFEALNAVERILLLGRTGGDAARYAEEHLALVPDGTFDLSALFGQVLFVGELKGPRKGLDARASDKAGAPDQASAAGQAGGGLRSNADEFFLGRGTEKMLEETEEEPILEDFEVADHNETDTDQPFEPAEQRAGDRALREGAALFFHTDLRPTEELAETHYWRIRRRAMDASLVTMSPFWADFARAPGESFASSAFPFANRSTTERLLALAFLDLPFDAAEHAVAEEGRAVTLTAGSTLLVALEDIVPPGAVDPSSVLLVGQEVVRLGLDGRPESGPPIGAELLTGVPYAVRTVLSNPTPEPIEVHALTQVPEGSIALQTTFATGSAAVALAPFGTRALESSFYFPAPGTFRAFGAHVGRGETLLAASDALTLRVVDEPTEVDTTTWEWVSQNGSLDEVLAHIDERNPAALELSRITWRMAEAEAFDAVTASLQRHSVFAPELWRFAVLHRRPGRTAEFLQHEGTLRDLVGYAFRSPLLDVVPGETGAYEHLAYDPLVVGRILPFGAQPRIQNEDFRAQYDRFLLKLAYQPALTPSDELELCEYLVLQERVPEALERFDRIAREDVPAKVQYDHMRAYLGLSRGLTAEPLELARRYRAHPVARWRNRFNALEREIDLALGRAPEAGLDPGDPAARQRALAGDEPVLEVAIRGGRVHVDAERIDAVELRYHPMDVEFLFSASPFVGGERDAFGLVEPAWRDLVALDSESAAHAERELPAGAARQNLVLEARGVGLARRVVHFAGSVEVQGLERFGQVRVIDGETRAPLPRTYVKVYARLRDGTVRFHKDGYTDLRGRFDHVSRSGEPDGAVVRYALLALHAEKGATIAEFDPPAR